MSYFRRGCVLSSKIEENEISGKVAGSQRKPYESSLVQKGNKIVSDCSCPLGMDCKHCVALALDGIEKFTKGKQDPEKPKEMTLSYQEKEWFDLLQKEEREEEEKEKDHFLLYQINTHYNTISPFSGINVYETKMLKN